MKSKINPLVSICIPAYNADKYIISTIEAILDQTYDNIEIIVVDDASSDHTIEKIKELNDPRIVLLSNNKKGAASARNYAFLNSKGDFIIFFDADDLIPLNFIETQLQVAIENDASVVVSAWGRFYGNDILNFMLDTTIIAKDLTFYEWIVEYWTFYNHTTPPGRVIIPRNILMKAGLWDEKLSLNDDFEFFTRIFLAASTVRYNPNGVLYYRSGINGLSSSKLSSSYRSYFRSLELSLKLVEERFSFDKNIDLACANLWQMFIYHAYPLEKLLLKKAEVQVQRLGGANIDFPAGGKTKVVSKIFGWKIAKLVKNLSKTINESHNLPALLSNSATN